MGRDARMDRKKNINVYVNFVLDRKGRDYMPYPLILSVVGLKLEALDQQSSTG